MSVPGLSACGCVSPSVSGIAASRALLKAAVRRECNMIAIGPHLERLLKHLVEVLEFIHDSGIGLSMAVT